MNTNLIKSVFYIVISLYLTVGASTVYANTVLQDDKESSTHSELRSKAIKNLSFNFYAKERYNENIIFKHGDVSWLSSLASQAGWPKDTHSRLAQIILRESGGCPNRRGGDAVDKNCNITHVTEWNHRSDTGLLQINGVNYDITRNKWAALCLRMNICTQEPLLDPHTNLKAGYLLYQISGWGPWDPCTWGPKYAHRCKP